MSDPTPTEPLVSARLTLRPPGPADAGRIVALAGDPAVARMTAAIPHPYPPQAAQAFIDRMAAADPRRHRLFAIDVDGEGLAGMVGFHPTACGAAEIGYWLGRPYWGRGYMTEAVRAALAWAGGVWGRGFVMAGHFTDNDASGRVLIKSGFLYTGDVQALFCAARGEAVPVRRMVWLA